jgi:hypothetical protein
MITENGLMRSRTGTSALAFLAVWVITLTPGCKRHEPEAGSSSSGQALDDSAIVAMYKGITQGLTPVAFDGLTAAHIGQRLVIKARTPDRADPPPPPRGMVKRMGDVSIYTAELHEILPDSLKIRAAYPTSGNLKIIEIPRADIQAMHLGK